MDESTPTSLPKSGTLPPVPESVSSASESSEEREGVETPDFVDLPGAHHDTMRRLYRRVEQAAGTIERLRAENERLRRRVDELEEQPAFPDSETVLTLDDDPETVRERVTRFIDAIDTYLEAVDRNDDASEEDADN